MSNQYEIKIEKGIPIPPRYTDGAEKIPLSEMKVKDSVYILQTLIPKTTVRAIVGKYQRGIAKKFTCRADALGMRIWRIK